MELKKSVVKGMIWSAAEKAGTMLFQICVSLILARMLFPEDYGLIGILVVFTSVFSVFADFGLSAALIRKKEVSDRELSSVFFFNMAVSLLIYFILLAFVPILSDYYGIPMMRKVAPVLFLTIPINAVSLIQTTLLTRKLDFKSISKYSLWATFISSGISVGLALAGFGVWALVGQRVLAPVIKAMLLWIREKWRPGKPAFSSLPPMLGYSSRLFVSDLANSVYANVSQLFIGKMYTTSQLGYYEQARKLKEMPVTSVISSIQGVTFPALSQLQDDHGKMSHSGHQVTVVMNFIVFPMMIGLIAIAADVFAVLLADRWMPTVPYFRILCISGLFAPVSVVSYNILKIKSNGKMILRLEMVKKAIATAVLVLTIPVSVRAIVWGQVIIFLTDAVLNIYGANRFIKWRLWDRVKEIMPYLVFSLIMWAVIHGIGVLLAGIIARYWILIIKIFAGVLVYFLLCRIFKPEAWKEMGVIFKQILLVR